MHWTKPSLRSRFVAAILLVVVLLSSIFYAAVSQFIEYLEYELIATRVQQELQEFVKQYEGPGPLDGGPPASEDTWRYVFRSGDAPLPTNLVDVPPGLHDDVVIDGREFYIGRQDVASARLYVGVDMEPVEKLERRLLELTFVCIVAGLLLSWLLARALAALVTRPVEELARLVSKIRPDEHSTSSLSKRFRYNEIGLIARAFDRYTRRVQQSLRREQAFTEDASHDLRTPIAVIFGAAQLLEADEELKPLAQRRVQRILRASNQMHRLTHALLLLARESSENTGIPIELHTLLLQLCELQQEWLGERPVTITVNVAAAQTVTGDRGLIESLVSNLLANAVENMQHGRIDVSLLPGRLIVQDDGPGIAMQDMARIFEHGYRGDDSRGFGLGLSIVARIARRLNWSVRVSNTPGSGACFEIGFGLTS